MLSAAVKLFSELPCHHQAHTSHSWQVSQAQHGDRPHRQATLHAGAGKGKKHKIERYKTVPMLSSIEIWIKPVQNIQGSGFDEWAVEMAEAAKHKNVFCKLSGLVNEVLQSIIYKYWERKGVSIVFKTSINHSMSIMALREASVSKNSTCLPLFASLFKIPLTLLHLLNYIYDLY